jgi:prepilin-type N-terminal cleavage/methylation domain-containing protein
MGYGDRKVVERKHLANAFTMIELIVVLAVVAILAACLFPVFAQAKEAAKRPRCLLNTKQITMAVIAYSVDCDDQLPRASFDEQYGDAHPRNGSTYVAGGQYQWLLPDRTHGYIKDQSSAYICPKTNFRLYPEKPDTYYLASGSYAYFCGHSHTDIRTKTTSPLKILLRFFGPGNTPDERKENLERIDEFFACGNKVARAEFPSGQPLIMCNGFVHGDLGVNWEEEFLPKQLGGLGQTSKVGGTTIGLLDGHAKIVRGSFEEMMQALGIGLEGFPSPEKE